MINFLLLINKLGQTRISSYYVKMENPKALESELIRKCVSRNDEKSNFFYYKGFKIIFRRYASLYFIIGIDKDENNELNYLYIIHNIVQMLDSHFESVCELDIMYNVEQVYYLIDEIIQSGEIIETNWKIALAPLKILEKVEL